MSCRVTPYSRVMSTDLTFGVARNIDRRLSETGERRYQLAAALGMVPGSLSKRMTGQVDWSLPELALVAQHLDLALSELVTCSCRRYHPTVESWALAA